jgi:RimJ/RimL family protein N-acetyltransferase
MDSIFTVRPLDEGDRERLRRLFFRLSPNTVYRRFMSPIPEPSERALDRLVDVDHRDREALAAVVDGEVIAVARFARDRRPDQAEIAIVVEDAWQRQGIGKLLLALLARRAREEGITAFTATMIGENRPAARLLKTFSDDATFTVSQGEIEAVVPIRAQAASVMIPSGS